MQKQQTCNTNGGSERSRPTTQSLYFDGTRRPVRSLTLVWGSFRLDCQTGKFPADSYFRVATHKRPPPQGRPFETTTQCGATTSSAIRRLEPARPRRQLPQGSA